MAIHEVLKTEVQYDCDVCVCGGGVTGITASTGDDRTSPYVKKLQREIVTRGGKLHKDF